MTVSGQTNGVVIGAGDNPASLQFFNGLIDEVTIYNRTLSAAEVLDHYKRGALNLKYHTMSCDDASCSGETWLGPDGTARTYYNESNNSTIFTPSSTLSNILTNKYFRYRAYFADLFPLCQVLNDMVSYPDSF